MELMNPTGSQLSYRGAAFDWSDYTFLFRYDFTSLSEMWQDTGGTTPALAGQNVARVDDQSGNGHNILQGTEADKPTANAVADGPGIAATFDGVSNFMQPAALTSSSGDYVFMAILDTDGATEILFDVQTGRFILTPNHASGAYFDGAWRGSDISSTSLQNICWRCVSPSSSAIYLDGVVDQSGVSYTQNAIGGGVAVGSSYTGTGNWWEGTLRHFWCVEGSMTNAQINEIGSYLAGIHGLSWTNIS